MQRQLTIDGILGNCPGCQGQPKHYIQLGKDLHFFECSPCGVRTAKFPTFQEAVAAWEQHQSEVIRVRQ